MVTLTTVADNGKPTVSREGLYSKFHGNYPVYSQEKYCGNITTENFRGMVTLRE
jgi:hypothetical protein